MIIPQVHKIIFEKKESVADNTDMYFFQKPEGFTFLPGQFATVRIPSILHKGSARDSVRALSIASAPSENHIAFAWRRSDSVFKKTAALLNHGDEIEMIAPAGRATLPNKGHVVFLIGGIGITPVRSIFKENQYQQNNREMTLLYSNRTQKSAAFFVEMNDFNLDQCSVVNTLTEPTAKWSGETGFITQEMVRRHVKDCDAVMYYIVGAGGFVDAMEKIALALGAPKENIICDNFG